MAIVIENGCHSALSFRNYLSHIRSHLFLSGRTCCNSYFTLFDTEAQRGTVPYAIKWWIISLGCRLVASGFLPLKGFSLLFQIWARFANDFSSSEAHPWWAVFSLLVLLRGTWSRPLIQPWWKFSFQFCTASLSSFPTWRRSSPRSSVGRKQVWMLGGRQAPQAAAQMLQERNLWMGSSHIYSESNPLCQWGYHLESQVLRSSSQVYWYFS